MGTTSASELPKLYHGVQKGSFGYKMLATMGWQEGLGLVRHYAHFITIWLPRQGGCISRVMLQGDL
jgi:hypothetical protein